MYTFKFYSDTEVQLIESGGIFPLDFHLYQDFLANGGVTLPADPPYVPSYSEKRASEYPPMSDYLDAVVKGDLVQQQAYIDACLAVKAKYQKEAV